MTVKIHKPWVVLSGAVIMLLAGTSVSAGELQVPNQFNSGDATSAAQMNANFSAVETAVNDNDQRISDLEGASGAIFQGFSEGVVNGYSGMLPMIEACGNTYPGSKVCTTVEFRDSPFNAGALNLQGNAWIFPVLIGSGGSTSSVREAVTATAVEDTRHLTCDGWRVTRGYMMGTVVSAEGKILVIEGAPNYCTGENRVACCR